MKTIMIILLFAILLYMPVSHVHAIVRTTGDLQVTYEDPLFPATTVWYPGFILQKNLVVKNIGSSTHKISIKAGNTSETGGFADVLLFNVSDGNTHMYGGNGTKSLNNFWNDGQIELSDLDSGRSKSFYITVTMPPSLGNEFQMKIAKFDLNIGFSDTSSTLTISGSSSNTNTLTAVKCGDSKPTNAPVILSAVSGINSVTLNWSPAGEPVSYYLIAYGISPNNSTYGNPNIGNKYTTSYTVTGLSKGTSYCFIIRGGNGCTPGDFSNTVCAVPGGIISSGYASGFQPGILGISTPSATLTATPSAKIGDVASDSCLICSWWQSFLNFIIWLYHGFFNK